ncbi:MAG: hypothetical protein IPM90_14540 [Austwickia sp.]|nr:hypothetical protein [Austwickia sp.]
MSGAPLGDGHDGRALAAAYLTAGHHVVLGANPDNPDVPARALVSTSATPANASGTP